MLARDIVQHRPDDVPLGVLEEFPPVSQRCRLDGDRVLQQPVEELPAIARGPPVEPERVPPTRQECEGNPPSSLQKEALKEVKL